MSSVRRADFIILNKVNLVTPEQKQKVCNFIEASCGDREIPIIESEYYIRNLSKLDRSKSEMPSRYEKVLLVSGIGNPNAFEFLARKNFDVQKHLIYRDHHKFSAEDVKRILKEAQTLGVQRILVTEKDAVKLVVYPEVHEKFWQAELSPKLSLRVKALYEKILTQFH